MSVNIIQELVTAIAKRAKTQLPWRVTTRELSRETTKVLGAVFREQRPAVVTYRGTPSFLILPLDQDKLAALLLSAAPQFRKDMLDDEITLKAGYVVDPSDLVQNGPADVHRDQS